MFALKITNHSLNPHGLVTCKAAIALNYLEFGSLELFYEEPVPLKLSK